MNLVTLPSKFGGDGTLAVHRNSCSPALRAPGAQVHPGVELWANLKSISHKCHLEEVAFVWELTRETIHLPLGCLQGVTIGVSIEQ